MNSSRVHLPHNAPSMTFLRLHRVPSARLISRLQKLLVTLFADFPAQRIAAQAVRTTLFAKERVPADGDEVVWLIEDELGGEVDVPPILAG